MWIEVRAREPDERDAVLGDAVRTDGHSPNLVSDIVMRVWEIHEDGARCVTPMVAHARQATFQGKLRNLGDAAAFPRTAR